MSKDLSNCLREPIAIIGIGCRFPGGIKTPQSFWEFLCRGGDGISETPSNRWSLNRFFDKKREKKGKLYVKKGGYLEEIDKFDPLFFGISPKEAHFMDPQQRLLLEVTWETFENAGIDPDSLTGSKTGVYVGLFIHDYENIHSAATEHQNHGVYSAIGGSATIAANRISNQFDLKGPSLVIDTACSSSLVCIHYACKDLLSRDTDLALASGVNLMLKPEMSMSLCKASMLSPDGYCKPFDEAANGYARAEGAATVILKRLSEAETSGDHIYAVIRGTAVNQDGCGQGLTMPNKDSQEQLILSALKNSCVDPKDVQYVEAHGTGTEVGDPIEAESLGMALGPGRTEQNACIIGSVKSNFGHTEAAAGIAGIIKTSLMLKHKKTPPNLHFNNPNPRIDFESLKLRVPVELKSWPRIKNKPRIASVNSFGFGGTNAHAVLQEHVPSNAYSSEVTDKSQNMATTALIPLSAKTKDGLHDTVTNLLNHLKRKTYQNDAAKIMDIGYTTALCRSHFSERICLVSKSQDELIFKLKQYLKNKETHEIVHGSCLKETRLKGAFIFSGMGQQWIGMGEELIRKEPIVKNTIEECDTLFRRYDNDWSLMDQIVRKDSHSRLHETRVAQPCIFALQVALARLWQNRGIFPDVIVGHSVGEIAASYVAGALNLDDALSVAFHRSRLQQLTSGKGSMLAVGMAHDEIKVLLKNFHSGVSIGALNSPTSVTLSGNTSELKKISLLLDKKNVFNRFLKVEVPYHSPAMDLITPDLELSLSELKPKKAKIPIVSTVTGDFIDGKEFDASYWVKNVRQPVLFQKALNTLIESKHSVFIEVSAHPVLAPSIREVINENCDQKLLFHSVKRNLGSSQNIQKSVAELYVNGYPIKWRKIYPKYSGKLVFLPNYPFQRKRYWNESKISELFRKGKDHHPVLGNKSDSGLSSWTKVLDINAVELFKEHSVQNELVFPAAAYLEMIRTAAKEEYNSAGILIENLKLTSPIVLEVDSQILLNLNFESNNRISIHSKKSSESDRWSQNANGSVLTNLDVPKVPVLNINQLIQKFNTRLTKSDVYRGLKERGLNYGKSFRLVQELWKNNQCGIGKISIEEENHKKNNKFNIQVTVLDSCFHILELIPEEGLYLPTQFKRIFLESAITKVNWAFCKITGRNVNTIEAEVLLYNDSGKTIAHFQQSLFTRVDRKSQTTFQTIEKNLFNYRWILQKNSHFISNEHKSPSLLELPSLTIEPQARFDRLSKEFEIEKLRFVVEKQLDDLCLQYIVNTFYKLSIPIKQGTVFNPTEIIQDNRIINHFKNLFLYLVGILEKYGVLAQKNDQWEVKSDIPLVDTNREWSLLIADHPILQAELFLLFKCGNHLHDILTGKQSPLNIIYSSKTTFVEHLYQHSPVIRIYNTLLKETVLELVEASEGRRKLKILEIGAGTGSLSSYLLPVLSVKEIEYTYTDIAPNLLSYAREKFSKFKFVDYRTLDITRSPTEQGLTENSYDIVVSSLTLHATPDLKASISNIKELLSSNGILVILEITKNPFWLDVIFGTLKDWWSFTDNKLRPDHPIIGTNSWHSLLKKEGFSEVEILKDQKDRYVEHAVIVAKNHEPLVNSASNHSNRESSGSSFNESNNQRWITVHENSETAHKLTSHLSNLGFDVLEATPGPEIQKKDDNFFELNLLELQQLTDFFKHVSQISLEPPNIIFVPDIGTIEHCEIVSRPEKKANHNCQKFLFIIQALMQQNWLSHPKFWLITHNARIIKKDEIVNIVQAPLEGMRRVVANEYPGLDSWAIDLSGQHDEKEINLLITELLHFSNDDEIAFRGNERYVNRLYPHIPNGTEGFSNHEVFLSKNDQRKNHNSFYQEYKQTDPGANEVQVAVRSASLNLNDLDYSELKRSNRATQSGYGREFSGFVTKVGHECEDYMPGQEVFGICRNACSSTVNVNLKNIAFKPIKLNHFAASAIPSSFICASHILKYLLPIQNIKTILITNATDEIGLAFLQLLKSTDINIHVTADTNEKLNYLKALGIENAGLIGDEGFLKMLALKSEKSPDAIINISDKQLSETELSLLPPYRGHLIQISQNQKSNTFVHKDLPQGISLQIINPLDLINSLDNEIGILLKEISSNIDSGKIYSFPFRLFNVNEHQAAIEYLKNPNRIGKTCLLINEHPVESKPFTAPVNIDPKMAYLIVGGLKGFGLATAEWLVSKGARYLILISRQGPNNKECIVKIRELEQQGAKIVAESADIADEESINRVFQKIEKESIPLAGIIHSAMVLDIALIANMSFDQLNKVLSPKITGSWNLYKFSKLYALDFFIFYSSMTTTLGFSGQANYAAGNSFCNAMAHFMRMQGINAYSFCWGLIDEAGWVARHGEARFSVEQSGFYTQSLDQAWQTIQYGLSNNIVELNASPIEWSIAGKYMPTISKTARLSHFLEETSDESKTKNDEKKDKSFKFSLDHNLTIETITTELINDLSQSLGIEKECIEKDFTLGSLNFDSLIAVELGLKIKNKFEVDIPKVLLLQENLLIEELGEMIQKEIFRRISKHEIKSNEENVKLQPTVKIDLLAETCLPDDIVPSLSSTNLSKGPSKVLLTGATGFLGAYLLHQLINTTQLEIVCLVRPKSSTPVDERVYDNLIQYGLWKEEYKERIRVIKGDLSQPRLGLPETVWSELARTVNVIYHNGSWLNFAQPYTVLKPTNVDGTREMLRLACENTTKPFHYVSTLIKISQTSADPDRIARQGFSHDEPTAYNSGYVQRNGFNIGYHQSKWVAEELVLEAENRGLPTTIYRPSLIAADSRSGLWNKNDYICLLLKGCMEIGMAPDQNLFFDFCPVDYISQAIVYLSQQAGSLGNNYLLKNPNPIKWNDLIRWMAANVSKIDLVSPEYWLNSVQSNIEKNKNSSLYGLLTLFEIRPLERIVIGTPPYILSPGIIEKNITRRALKPSIVCPPIDDRLLKKYFQDF